MRIAGFVDLQVNGYAGIDLNDPGTSLRDVLEMAEILGQKGTAGFLATIITNSADVMEVCVSTVARAMKEQPSPGRVLGIHLEGPFISAGYGYRGVHPAEHVRGPDLEWFRRVQVIAEGNVRLITLAPEYSNAVEFIRAVAGEVVVSVGHSDCSYGELRAASASGLSMGTHVGNGCRQTIDRHQNPIVNILACTELTLSFIADGFHLPEAFIRTLIASRSPEKLIVVSDSTSMAGVAPGRYTWCCKEVVLRPDGRLHLADDENLLAGSSCNMMQCMNRLASLDVLSEEALWSVGHTNPLRVLGRSGDQLAPCGKGIRYEAEKKRFEPCT